MVSLSHLLVALSFMHICLFSSAFYCGSILHQLNLYYVKNKVFLKQGKFYVYFYFYVFSAEGTNVEFDAGFLQVRDDRLRIQSPATPDTP